MKWIDSTDLKNWAPRRDCQENLPLVIRRLIRATVSKIDSIFFPAGDSTVYPGWDGRLESKEETEYIPNGLSVWEIGTHKDIKTKAEEDYKKRQKDPLEVNPLETTYIFATPRVWTKKDEWAKEKKEEDFWKDVRVYDARDLEEWLERTPAVGAWLAKYLNKYPEDVLSLEDWWNEWSQVTHPPINPELVLAGRKEQIEEVKNWLISPPSSIAVQGSTKDESVAFLSAVILSSPEPKKEYFLSRAIVLPNKEAFRHITATCKNNMLLIFEFEEVEIAFSQHNHHVFIPLDPVNTVTQDKILLPILGRDEFVSALKKMGISEENAERYSRDTGRSLSVLRRRLSPASKQPEWARSDKAREILPALLAGKWNESKQEDKEKISELAKRSYDEFVATLSKWLNQSDSPVLKIGNVWRLTSTLDAFFVLSPFLTSDDFEKLKEVSFEVLGMIDPSLELEPEKRWMASIYGKNPKYSKELREGIAQTLVLISVFGNNNNLDIPNSWTSQVWVDSIIRELLNKGNGKLWYSLSDVLPLIAESSPTSFLDAVEESLTQDIPPLMEMFSETEDAFTSHSPHPSLLWALESLAWDPNLLGRVALILGKLARLDPGGKIANRPINSLRTIFLLWLPNTYATLRQRLEAINTLIEREPKIGWDLLISLMPRDNDIGSFSYKPRWRQFLEKTDNKVTIKEPLESISAVMDKILMNVSNDGKKWAEIMEQFSNLPPEERRRVLEKLSVAVDLIESDRKELRNKLRDMLSNHRSFSDAQWALPEEELRKIEAVYNKFEPKDKIERYQWLFDDYWPKLPEGRERLDHMKFEQMVTEKRIEVAVSIKDDLGVDGLINLANQSKNPQIVGATTADLSLADNEEQNLLSLFGSQKDKEISFIQGYIGRKSFKNGDDWIMKVVNKALSQKWSNDKANSLFLALPQNRTIWNLLEKFDAQTQEEYWKNVQPRFFDLSLEDKIYGLEKLVSVKRHFSALGTAAMFAKEVPPRFIVELLRKAALEKGIDNFRIIDPWDIDELFIALDQSKEAKWDEIVKLEWLYLPILARVGGTRPPRNLHQELSMNHEFFAEVIKWIYKPANENNNEEEELSIELKEQRARLAGKLLYTWKIVPGSDCSGKIDYQKLKTWIEKTREVCKKQYRLRVCDEHIGQVLVNAMPDENGNWPPEEVCRIIDEVGSKDLDNGFIVGLFNKRGMVTKSTFEGGNQERKLARRYQGYAEKWATNFPKTSAILKKVAEDYENDAKREDEQAKRRDLEW